MITIRLATDDDKAAIVRMSTNFAEWTKHSLTLRASVDRVPSVVGVGLERFAIYIAWDKNIEVGFISLHTFMHPWVGEKICEVVTIWTELDARPSWRVGWKLLVAAQDWATTNGCAWLKMSSPTGSPLGTFLERRGFSELETAWVKRL